MRSCCRVTLLSRKLKLAGMKIPIMENWGNILLLFTSQHVTWDARLECEVRWGEGSLTNFVQFIILDIQLMLQRDVMAVKWDQLLGRPTSTLTSIDGIILYFVWKNSLFFNGRIWCCGREGKKEMAVVLWSLGTREWRVDSSPLLVILR